MALSQSRLEMSSIMAPIVWHGTRAASRQLSTARCAALDRPPSSRRHSRQRALGRILSAAREHAPTIEGSSHAIEPFSCLYSADFRRSLARVLVEYGADPSHRNADGLTAIDFAERRRLLEV